MVESIDKVDKWGHALDDKGKSKEIPEGPPKGDRWPGFKVINFMHVSRVVTDNPNIALYFRDGGEGMRLFYQKQHPLKFSIEDEKVLYVFFRRELIDPATR